MEKSDEDENNACPPYTYEPLPPEAHTRILELHPSMDLDAPLHCTLQPLHLDDDSSYEALSYTWGVPDFTEQLIFDGQCSKMVTSNLHDALRRFRRQLHVRRIWVDALCINQDDPLEKTRQIPNMSEIYRSASTVLVWLGNDETAQECVQRIDSLARMKRPQLSKSAADAFANLARLPWFNRRWIIQEVVLNANVTLFAGLGELSWTRLSQVHTRLLSGTRQFNSVLFYLIDLWMTLTIQTTTPYSLWPMSKENKVPQIKIRNLMIIFQESLCADDRDRIFAFSSISSDRAFNQSLESLQERNKSSIFEADYTKTTEQTYTNFTRYLVVSGAMGLFELLYIKEDHIRNGHQLEGQPSWALDWRVKLKATTTRDLAFYSMKTLIDAQFDEYDNSRLNLQSKYIFRLSEVIVAESSPFPQCSESGPIYAWLKEMIAFVETEFKITDATSRVFRRNVLASLAGVIYPPGTNRESIKWFFETGELPPARDGSLDYLPASIINPLSSQMQGKRLFVALGSDDAHCKYGFIKIIGIGPNKVRTGDFLFDYGKNRQRLILRSSPRSGHTPNFSEYEFVTICIDEHLGGYRFDCDDFTDSHRKIINKEFSGITII